MKTCLQKILHECNAASRLYGKNKKTGAQQRGKKDGHPAPGSAGHEAWKKDKDTVSGAEDSQSIQRVLLNDSEALKDQAGNFLEDGSRCSASVIEINRVMAGKNPKTCLVVYYGSNRMTVPEPVFVGAEALRQKAFRYAESGNYKQAYKTVRMASELDPVSVKIADARKCIVSQYRKRLYNLIYFILVPWLPFLIYARFFAGSGELESDTLPGGNQFLSITLVLFAVTVFIAIRIHLIKEKIR